MQEAYTRRHERLTQYWNQLRGARPFPAEAEIDPAALAEMWEHCFLVTVKHDGRTPGYRYTYLGQALAEAYGYDPQGQNVAEVLVDPHSGHLVPKFDEVCRTGKPLTDEGHFTNRNRVDVRYRCCMLPVANGKPDEVAFIVGMMDWKGY